MISIKKKTVPMITGQNMFSKEVIELLLAHIFENRMIHFYSYMS